MKSRLKNEDETLLKWKMNYFIGLQHQYLIELAIYL